MIKALFFDLHKVIIHGDFSSIYNSFAKRVGISEELVTNYHQNNLPSLLRGSITLDDMRFAFGLADKMTTKEMSKIWTDETLKIMKVDEKMLSLLDKLKNKYILATLTNLTEHRYEADVFMGLYDYFDYRVLSFKEGIKKPSAVFFERSLDLTDLSPSEVIFIDDQEKNTKAAEEVGMKSVLFEGHDRLVQDLQSLGINI